MRDQDRPEPCCPAPPAGRDHVVILDGTLASLVPGQETNAGQIFRLLCDLPPAHRPAVFYEEGLQWRDWQSTPHVLTGRGINRQIRRAYAFLAAGYRPGDRIFLFGYSRGAYAVRSLAGLIDRIGLLRANRATPQMIEALYRLYQSAPHGARARAFARRFCHREVSIEVVGVFDTVKALGWRLPGLAVRSERAHAFHSHHLGHRIRRGYHALALDETRQAFTPVLWTCPQGWRGEIEQMWFRGTHADIGGQLSGFSAARPLANIPLVWMLDRAAQAGLPLPPGWRSRFPTDPAAPSRGAWHGLGKVFVLRAPRIVGADPSERVHPSAGVALPRPNLVVRPDAGAVG